MLTLHLEPGSPSTQGSEINTCVFSPDGGYLLTGGWDGYLRKWCPVNRNESTSFHTGDKPISACAISPDGATWLSGNLEGMLATWTATSHLRRAVYLAHSRPLSCILFAPEGTMMATASWDRQIILWDTTREREGRTLAGHRDIVTGCRFTPDGLFLLSWSHDGTLRFWDTTHGQLVRDFAAHSDRITAGDIAPDGRLATTGSRKGGLRLWDVEAKTSLTRTSLPAEIRGCYFLLDGESLVTVDAEGQLVLHSLPELEVRGVLDTRLRVQCGALAPTGGQIALGCSDGSVRFVTIQGAEAAPLVVRVTRTEKLTATRFQKLLGRNCVTHAFQCRCPVCLQEFEIASGTTGQTACCPRCQRSLRVGAVTRPERPVAHAAARAPL